jgi:predicted nucleic acid-binding protein
VSGTLLDTSVVVTLSEGGTVRGYDPNARLSVSAVTLAGLHHGLLVAPPDRLADRIAAMQFVVRACEVLPVDDAVAERYGRIAADARRIRGRRIQMADGLIAATAVVHGLRLYTSDADFRDLPGVDVVVV